MQSIRRKAKRANKDASDLKGITKPLIKVISNSGKKVLIPNPKMIK